LRRGKEEEEKPKDFSLLEEKREAVLDIKVLPWRCKPSVG